MRRNGDRRTGPDRPARLQVGFTLIELLVVITIITILAALLMPVLADVRWNANKIVSTSQLRQLQVVLSLYADDNEGSLPNTTRPDHGSSRWDDRFIIHYPDNMILDNLLGHTLWPYIDNRKMLMAPNHWQRLNAVHRPAVDANTWRIWFGHLNATSGKIRETSYAYLPRGNPNARVGRLLGGVPYGQLALMQEMVAGSGYASDYAAWGPHKRDLFPGDRHKSVNYRNGEPEGGSVLWGDASVSWVPVEGYRGERPEWKQGQSKYTLWYVLNKR